MNRSHRLSALAAVCFLSTLPLGAQTPKEGAGADPAAKKAGRAAIQQCKELAARAKGTKGEARKKILGEAASAYQALLQKAGIDAGSRAQAAYTAGSLRRSMGELDAARSLYEQSRKLQPERYGARAGLELAHLDRRQDKLDAALKGYAAVAAIQPASARAHQARLWLGRVHLSKKDAAQAEQAFRTAVEKAGTSRQRIDACNRLANLEVKLGKLDAARKTIAVAEQASKQAPAGEGAQAERQAQALHKAYAKMSARRALQRAADKVQGTSRDVRELQHR